MIEAAELLRHLGLKPHPEGGYYLETYRSAGVVPAGALPRGLKGKRNFATAICYLLPAGEKSRLHRLASDETWHFYAGGPLELYEIAPDGRAVRTVLGNDFRAGQKPWRTITAGNWFGARPGAGAAYSLVGCTVSPGFDFADLEIGRRKRLLDLFPGEKEMIELLTD